MLFLGVLSIDQTVIAAVGMTEQESATQAIDSSGILAWWMIPASVVSLIIFTQIPDWRLKKAQFFKPSFSSAAGLILFAAALMGGMLGFKIAQSFAGPPLENGGYDLASTLPLMIGHYIGQGVVFLLLPGLVIGRKTTLPSGYSISLPKAALAGCLGLVIVFPITLAVAQIAAVLIEWTTGQTFNQIGHGTLQHIKDASNDPDVVLILVILMVSVVTPIWEEILYRGMLQESIRSHPLVSSESPWVAIIITSLIFTTMHIDMVDLRGLPGLFVLSLGFGWIYLRTGRLLASIVMHAAFNAINILIVIL